MHQVIAERPFSETGFEEAAALDLLRDVVRARRFDERALALQRRGWMSGYPPFQGQEASQVGAAHAMREGDWLVPTYRSNAMQLARGVPMSDILAFRRGHAEYASDHDLNVLPQAVPIASQIPHAAGIGMAQNYREDDESATLCYFGDGATSEGDFHEGVNFAGVFDAPVVFFCENNHWAISTPQNRQTASDSIAVKADAYGIEGVQVDGMDPLAVRKVVSAAMDVARDGTPVLVESLTYRQGPHTTSDDPSKYRDDDPDLPEWRTRDPVERYVEYLTESGVVDEDTVEELREAATEEVADAVDHVEETETADPDDVFDHLYEDLPPRVREQREFVRSRH
ncbi:thiamine pyrophosphate-dependent dehydrogenase E1 component subunit alpha [Halomarina oriensis]|uniref:Pyruvate dehydrogenase (Acetyl-transferring) E1 component subunit alpha n=1 Tax=Halomarina oriensis TaxID=671145 RepID=A0A6B0GKV0_9EURY|nr:thiamine pyrophosphate-dependent dehydrogenase E1 component subunit alpha [Halomarina oriensis]MWG34069.1 pyruvate dehydrogenase (acetyl-transferring) E1 component subunit alpha [Halomarina oriensis]